MSGSLLGPHMDIDGGVAVSVNWGVLKDGVQGSFNGLWA